MWRLPDMAALNAMRGHCVVRTVVGGEVQTQKPGERPVRVQGKSPGEAEFLLHLRATKLPAPRTEYEFHPTRGWRFDVAWPDLMIAFEVEGGIWKKDGGGHSHPTGILRDIEKYNAAARLGWLVFRVTTDMVTGGEGIQLAEDVIGDAIREKKNAAIDGGVG